MSPQRAFLLVSALVLFTLLLAAPSEGKQLIRINVDGPSWVKTIPIPKGMEHVSSGRFHVDFLALEPELAELNRRGIAYTVLDPDVEQTLRTRAASYHSLAQMETIIQNIASSYPAITNLFSLGQSYQGRDIWCLEISDNPGVDEGEPELLYVGLHHAREWPSLEMGLHIAQTLTGSYGSDPTITSLVDTRRVWVVPCMNPDGFYYCHDQGHDWRKNRHYFSQFGTYGVDLNRNYPGCTCGDPEGDWGSIGDGSVSHNSGQEVYCGPGAGSELETQAIMNLILERNFTALLTYHTYSELVLWPYGTNITAPDNSLLASTGQAMASRISGQYGGTYTPQQSVGLYPTTGDTTDWAYGISFYEQGKNLLPYTIEMGASGFQPPTSALQQILDENWDAALYLLQQAENLRSAMTPFVIGPELDAPDVDYDGNYTVSWTEANPGANPTQFQLDELTGLSVVTDDVEAGGRYWDLDGFATSTTYKHSGSYSFRGRNDDAYTSAMVSKHALPVEAGMQLSFWTWYDIETNWDFAFVEVSTNKRKWDQLAAFTGNSSGWKEKTYSLADYVGRSIYLRFRYSTDGNTLGSGFYVDDIFPVPEFAAVNTLSSTIPDAHYDLTGKGNGDYYYRVKGYSATRGWGDFSVLDKTVVDTPPGPLYADTYTVSASAGFEINFTLDAGSAYAGREYLLLGSFSGSTPGIPLPGGPVLPLNWDLLTDWILLRVNTSTCQNFLGTLSGAGQSAAVFDSNGSIPSKHAGKNMTFAYLLGPPPGFDYASNAISVLIIP